MCEPFILINPSACPRTQPTPSFSAGRPASRRRPTPPASGARRHQAVSPETRHRIVTIAQGAGIEWQAALTGFQPQGERRQHAQTAGIYAQPAFYRLSP